MAYLRLILNILRSFYVNSSWISNIWHTWQSICRNWLCISWNSSCTRTALLVTDSENCITWSLATGGCWAYSKKKTSNVAVYFNTAILYPSTHNYSYLPQSPNLSVPLTATYICPTLPICLFHSQPSISAPLSLSVCSTHNHLYLPHSPYLSVPLTTIQICPTPRSSVSVCPTHRHFLSLCLTLRPSRISPPSDHPYLSQSSPIYIHVFSPLTKHSYPSAQFTDLSPTTN